MILLTALFILIIVCLLFGCQMPMCGPSVLHPSHHLSNISLAVYWGRVVLPNEACGCASSSSVFTFFSMSSFVNDPPQFTHTLIVVIVVIR